MHMLVLHLLPAALLGVTCGCSIPIYSATPTNYRCSRVERDLEDLLPESVPHTEARSILKKNGFDDVVLIARDVNGVPQNELVATQHFSSWFIRVTMPISSGQVIRPFELEWVETESGNVKNSETTGSYKWSSQTK